LAITVKYFSLFWFSSYSSAGLAADPNVGINFFCSALRGLAGRPERSFL
jgi:hypothetical protein